MKHFHIYDTTGEVMCVDADTWIIAGDVVYFYNEIEKEPLVSVTVATFNWSNVVCVREEEDDDGEDSTPMPDYLQGVLN